MIKFLLIAAACLVTLVLLLVLVGLFLPKTHRASRQARFHQSPEALFALLTGPQSWRNVAKTDLPPADNHLPRWQEKAGRDTITFEQTAATPPTRVQTRIADKSLPFGGTWTYTLTPNPDGTTTLQITEDGIVYNPLFRVISRFVMGHTKTIDTYLSALAAHLHESPAIEPASPHE